MIYAKQKVMKVYKCYYSVGTNSKLMCKPWLDQDFFVSLDPCVQCKVKMTDERERYW